MGMDYSNTLKTEAIRPITTVVIPGAFATGPYFLVAAHYFERVPIFWESKPLLFAIISIIIIISSGLMMENLGGFLEEFWINQYKKKDPNFEPYWEKYLKLKIENEYVGQRYLRTIVTRMYFELSFFSSLLFFFVGAHWANYVNGYWNCTGGIVISTAILSVIGFTFYEAGQSVNALNKLRKKIVDGVNGV